MIPSSSPPPSSYRTAENSPENSPESSVNLSPVTRIQSGRIIVLLGAPRTPQLLLDEENSPASRGQISGNVDHVTSTHAPGTTDSPAAWRILPLKRKHLRTGFSQGPDIYTPVIPEAEADEADASASTGYDSTASSNFAPTCDTDRDDDGMSRSFAAHNIPSSPVTGPDLTVSFAATDITFSSFSSLDSPAPRSSLPNIQTAALIHLGKLPTASYIESIKLKMRVSIIAGITHIFPQRTFQPKHSNTIRSKQTLVVGDETAAGFKLDLWLPPGPLTFAGKTFMDTVEALRVGDVINVQNMVLGVWNNEVNGATVRKDQTRVELVYRTICSDAKERRRWRAVDLDSSPEDNCGAEKVKRVVGWTREFLGVGERPTKKMKEEYEEGETILPDDTQ